MVSLYPVKANAMTFVKQSFDKWDLVFADPPYDLRELADLAGTCPWREYPSTRGVVHSRTSQKI